MRRKYQTLLDSASEANVRFDDLRQLLLSLGFEERTKGSHHVFRRQGVATRINLQRDGAKAKPYQVTQVRKVLKDNRLLNDE